MIWQSQISQQSKISLLKTTLPSQSCPFKSTTPSQSRNWQKLVLSRPPYLPNVKIIQVSNFTTYTPSKSENYPKSVLSRPQHPPKVEIDDNESFQDHHTLPKWKWSTTSPLKSLADAQSTERAEQMCMGIPVWVMNVLYVTQLYITVPQLH